MGIFHWNINFDEIISLLDGHEWETLWHTIN